MKSLSESVVIVCGIVRNAEKGLNHNIPVLNMFLSLCKDFRVFIYENDSKDKSKVLLKKWHESDPNRIHVSLNQINSSVTIPFQSNLEGANPFFSYKRISKMVSLRNKYMDYIEQQGWNGDFLMIVDLDVSKLYIESIVDSFKTDIDWDAVTAYGYSLSPRLKIRYHDTYALTELGDEFNAQTEDKIISLSEKYGKFNNTAAWIQVFSAFGGLAIYKFDAVKGLRYKVLKNSDKRVEVRCEHYSLYRQMFDRGYDRIFINPSMRLKYQSITIGIVLNYIKRLLRRILLC